MPRSSVTVGGYSLEVGSPGDSLDVGSVGGTLASPASRPDDAPQRVVASALEQSEPGEGDRSPSGAAAHALEETSEATAAVERAVDLFRGLVEGRALDPRQLPREVDALVDLLERLDSEGRCRDAFRVARALSGLLALLMRWAELARSLQIALRAADAIDDLPGVAWASHELGTLRLAAGQTLQAERDLERARGLRQTAHDRAGLSATNHNLGTLCQRLRSMYREGELVEAGARRPPGWRHAAVLAGAAAALLALGGVAGGMVINGGGGGVTSDDGTSPDSRGGGTGTEDNRRGGGNGGGTTRKVVLEVKRVGQGTITSRPAGIDCPPDCRLERPAQSELQLTASAVDGSIFAGWRGGGCSGRGSCRIRLSDDTTVTAAFDESSTATHALIVEASPGGTVTSNPSGITCPMECDAEFASGALVTLTASSQEGYGLLSWSGACSGNAACAVSVDGDKRVEANFAELHRLTIELAGYVSKTMDGALQSDPAGISCPGGSCEAQFPAGTTVTLSSGDRADFRGGSGACTNLPTCELTLTRDEVVTADFGPG